jgi:hypothetical protein
MNNINVIICSLLLMTGFAQAQNVNEALTDCSKELDSLKRLVCYDRLAAGIPSPPLKRALPEETKTIAPELKAKIVAKAPIPVMPVTPATQKTAEQAKIATSDFGMDHKVKQDKIYATLTAVTKTPLKKLLLTLDNGQRWKQTDSGSLRLKVGEQVYVERGALSSFFVSKEGVNKRLRVKRIK